MGVTKNADKESIQDVEVRNDLVVSSVTIGDIGGDVGHDNPDSGKPLKVGGKAIDMTPDTDAEQGSADVGASDRVDGLFDLQGALVERVNSRYHVLDNVSSTYGVTATQTSTAISCEKYRDMTFGLTLAIGVGTPTDITFQLEVSLDGTNYFDWQVGAASQTETASGSYGYTVPNLSCQKVRLKVSATGTDGSNTFVVTSAAFYLRN